MFPSTEQRVVPQGQKTPETDLTAAEHPTPLKLLLSPAKQQKTLF